jgi:hypothetical protein
MGIESGADGITEAGLKIYRAAAGFTLTGMHGTCTHMYVMHAPHACTRIHMYKSVFIHVYVIKLNFVCSFWDEKRE